MLNRKSGSRGDGSVCSKQGGLGRFASCCGPADHRGTERALSRGNGAGVIVAGDGFFASDTPQAVEFFLTRLHVISRKSLCACFAPKTVALLLAGDRLTLRLRSAQ